MISKKIKKISLASLSIAGLITIPVLITACSSATPSTSEINNTNNTSLLESTQAKEGVLGFWQDTVINNIFSTLNKSDSFSANSAFNYTTTNSSAVSSISLSQSSNASYNSYRFNIINAYNSYIAYNSQTNPVTWWNEQTSTWLKNASLGNQINQNNLINPALLGQDYLLNSTTINLILAKPNDLTLKELGAQQFNNLTLFLILFNNISSQMQSLLNSFYLTYLYLTQQNMSNIEKGSDYSTNINNNSSSDFGIISNIDPNNPNFFLIKYLLSNTLVQKWQFTSSNATTIFQNNEISSLESFNSLVQSNYLGAIKKESSQFNIAINDPNTNSSSIFGYDGVNIADSTLTDGAFSSNVTTLKTFTQTMSGILDPSSNELIPFAALGKTGRNQILSTALSGLSSSNIIIKSNSNNISNVTTSDLSISDPTKTQLTTAGITLSITNVSSNSAGNNLNITFNINSSTSTLQPINFSMTGVFKTGTNDIEIPYSSILSNLQSQLVTTIPIVNNKKVAATYYNRLLPIFDINAIPTSGAPANVNKKGLFNMVSTPWATAGIPTDSNNGASFGNVEPYFVYSIIFSSYKTPAAPEKSSDSAVTDKTINEQNLAYALFVNTKDFYIKLGYTITVGDFAGNSGLITQAKALGIGN